MLFRGVCWGLVVMVLVGIGSHGVPAAHAGTAQSGTGPRTIWVLKARGVCDGCAEAVSKMLFTVGLRSQIVGPEQLKAVVGKRDVVVIGGSEPDADGEWTVQKELVRVGAFEWLKAFIYAGGRYVGICAGAYLTEAWIDPTAKIPGLALFPGQVDNHDKRDKSTKFIPVVRARDGSSRWVYFQDGPVFRPSGRRPVEVLATYDGRWAVAAAIFPYGRGKVAVAGPHYEADEVWAEHAGVTDPDGRDYDMGIELFQRVMQ